MTAKQDWPSWGVDAGQRFLSPNPPAGRSDLRKEGPDPAAWWRGAFQVGTLPSSKKAPIHGDFRASLQPQCLASLPVREMIKNSLFEAPSSLSAFCSER